MKKIIAIILSVMCVLTLASCQLSQLVPPSVTTDKQTDNTTKAPSATTTAPEITEDPTYDYMANDLTQFVTLCDYKGIKLTDKRVEVTDALVNRYIGELLVSNNEYTKRKTGVINEYDILNMDYVGKYKDTGVAFSGGSAMNVNFFDHGKYKFQIVAFSGGSAMNVNFFVTMNENGVYGIDTETFTPGYGYIDGFADAMIGKDISETFDIEVTFPEKYQSSELAGKDVIFTITVNYVCTPNELTEANLSLLTTKEKIDDYKEEVKEQLEDEYEEIARNAMDIELWDYLVENSEFKAYPEEYVEAFYASEIGYIESIAYMYGYETEDVLKMYGYESRDDFKERYVMYSIKQNIILYQILKNENLDFTDEAYNARLEEFAEEIDMTVEMIEASYSKEEILQYFRFEVVNEFVFASCEFVKE